MVGRIVKIVCADFGSSFDESSVYMNVLTGEVSYCLFKNHEYNKKGKILINVVEGKTGLTATHVLGIDYKFT